MVAIREKKQERSRFVGRYPCCSSVFSREMYCSSKKDKKQDFRQSLKYNKVLFLADSDLVCRSNQLLVVVQYSIYRREKGKDCHAHG
jgi:hypothetical protein